MAAVAAVEEMVFVVISAWNDLVEGRPSGSPDLELITPLTEGSGTTSRPFLATASDGQQWWVKHPRAGSGKRLVNELVVGKLGALIAAPVCKVEPIYISPLLLPWDLGRGEDLVAGVGCASQELDGAVLEVHTELIRRQDDDNRRRHAGAYALVDWCYGRDVQWLHQVAQDFALSSHDHGEYFPRGAEWDVDALSEAVRTPVRPPDDPRGLDTDELGRLSTALKEVTRQEILAVLNSVPADWAVTDRELDRLGWFVEERARDSAARLDDLAEQLESSW